MRLKILPPLLHDTVFQTAAALVLLFFTLDALELSVFETRLGFASFTVIPLLIIGITAFAINWRGAVGRERRFWSLLTASQIMWLLAELVYWIPGLEDGGVAVELANDFLLLLCYIALIVALQTSPHRPEEPSSPQRSARKLQAWGAILFASTLLLYFSLIPIFLDPALYLSLVPSTVMFVVLDVYLVAFLFVLLRETRSTVWRAIYSAIIVAEILWVFADTGEGLVYLGAIESTAPWASLLSAIAMLAKIVAARVARTSTKWPDEACSGARRPLAGWDGRLVVFGCLVPAMHVGLDLLGLQNEATRAPRELTVMAFLALIATIALRHHVILEKRNQRLERRYQETQERLVEEQLESVRLRERARADNAIQHSQRLESLGVLAGGIAHDFNNLLTGIVGNADLAMMQADVDSSTKMHIDEIMSASAQATALTNQMLAYAGKGAGDVRSIDLNQVVRDITVLLHASIHKGADLKLDLAADLPFIFADSAQIQQLVMNLVTNASEAIAGQTGTITICTGRIPSETDPSVFIEISDTGCGMNEETRRRMFDPFFSTKSTGRGLGLAAAEGIVRSHHGSLSVESTIGFGSSIRVVLPAIEEVQQAGELESGCRSQNVAVGGKVLVVDDEEMIRKLTRTVLESAGWQVVSAADGQTALNLFRKISDITAVVLDLTMPGKASTEVLDEMQRLRPDVPVILMSGYTEADVEEILDSAKAVRFLKKPFLRSHLLDGLAAVNC